MTTNPGQLGQSAVGHAVVEVEPGQDNVRDSVVNHLVKQEIVVLAVEHTAVLVRKHITLFIKHCKT